MRNSQLYNLFIADFSTSKIIKTTLNNPNISKKYLYWIVQDYFNDFPSYENISRNNLIGYIKVLSRSRNHRGVLRGSVNLS